MVLFAGFVEMDGCCCLVIILQCWLTETVAAAGNLFNTTGRTKPRFVKDDRKTCVFQHRFHCEWDLSQASIVVMNLLDGRSWLLWAKGSDLVILIN